ncbi:MAG TPA: type II toxin-antitoxin system RelE/ParE family toxin [Gammaproteobacteria bacterium]|nr:type II toxin-antitoxin system RelE/ParE family toxin [Gammaproteobacteria bacterium]
MRKRILQTVVETPEFIKQANDCMDDKERQNFINYIAGNPSAGALIQSTGGARKIRWQADAHKGKSGGARIIYFYYNQNIPIFLFTAYKKNKKINLTAAEKTTLRKIIKLIVAEYER